MNKNEKHCHKGKSSENFIDKKLILKELNILPSQTILDAGCGNGYMAKEFAKLAGTRGKVYALDPDRSSIELLMDETEKNNSIEAFVGDITQETKLKDSSIDLVYISTVIHGFSKEQMNGFINEVKRILKPETQLAILEINKEKTPFGPPMELRYSPDELVDKVGLPVLKTVNIGEYFYLIIFKR